MIAVRLPEDIERRLSNLARKTGRSETFYVQAAIRAHIEALEDMYLTESETTVAADQRSSRSWRDLLRSPKADDGFLKERPPVIDETRFLKEFEGVE